MKWTDINNGESGLSVRGKLNDALEYLINPPVHDVDNANYAIDGVNDKIILVTTGSSDRIITLPALSGTTYEGNVFVIIKIDNGSGKVVINGYGSDEIMGEPFITIGYQWEIYKLLKHQTLWIPIY